MGITLTRSGSCDIYLGSEPHPFEGADVDEHAFEGIRIRSRVRARGHDHSFRLAAVSLGRQPKRSRSEEHHHAKHNAQLSSKLPHGRQHTRRLRRLDPEASSLELKAALVLGHVIARRGKGAARSRGLKPHARVEGDGVGVFIGHMQQQALVALAFRPVDHPLD